MKTFAPLASPVWDCCPSGAASMKRFVALLASIILFGSGVCLRAEEPHLDFVRGLRERHYPDLALEYLEKLNKNPPPGLGPFILLEMAKTRLDKASSEPAVPKRLALYFAARGEFEAFLKNNPNQPLAPTARLEMARVTVLQGKTQLNQALRESGAAKQSAALKARTTLVEAGRQLQEASKELATLLETKYKEEPKTEQDKAAKKTLEQEELQAKLD